MCRRADYPPYPRRMVWPASVDGATNVNHSPGFARSADGETVRTKTRVQQQQQRQAHRRRFAELAKRRTVQS